MDEKQTKLEENLVLKMSVEDVYKIGENNVAKIETFNKKFSEYQKTRNDGNTIHKDLIGKIKDIQLDNVKSSSDGIIGKTMNKLFHNPFKAINKAANRPLISVDVLTKGASKERRLSGLSPSTPE